LTSHVKFGKSRIYYNIIKSPSRKRTEILVVGKNSVNVLAPESKSRTEIRRIVKSNSRWIFRKQLNLDHRQGNGLTYSDGSKLPYLGKKYLLCIEKNINISNNTILKFQKGRFIASLDNKDPDSIRILYEKWLAKQAIRILKDTVEYYSKLIGIDHNTLRIRMKSQRNRVGSLGRNLTVNFNKNIVRLPLKIIEYIVLHELCHIYIPSHSKKYWQLISKVMVDYKKRKEWLEKNCHTYL
jgi:predicted metal-dependent hydrolase